MGQSSIGAKGIVPTPVHDAVLGAAITTFLDVHGTAVVTLASSGNKLLLTVSTGDDNSTASAFFDNAQANSIASLLRVFGKHSSLIASGARSPLERFVDGLDVLVRTARSAGAKPGELVAALFDYALNGMHANRLHGRELEFFKQAVGLHRCRLDHLSAMLDEDALLAEQDKKAKG